METVETQLQSFNTTYYKTEEQTRCKSCIFSLPAAEVKSKKIYITGPKFTTECLSSTTVMLVTKG